jgi:hypothetical protein
MPLQAIWSSQFTPTQNRPRSHSEFDAPPFDFSSVPDAKIKARFYLDVTYERYIPVSTSLSVCGVYDPDLCDEGRMEEIKT